MGCGSSKLRTAISGSKRSSLQSTKQIEVKTRDEEDNPFLDTNNEHRIVTRKKAVIREEQKEQVQSESEDYIDDLKAINKTERGRKEEISEKKEAHDEDVENVDEEEVEPPHPAVAPKKAVDSNKEKTKEHDKDSITDSSGIARSATFGSFQEKADSSGIARSVTFGSFQEKGSCSYDLTAPNTLTTNLGAIFLHYAQKRYDRRNNSIKEDVDLDEEKLDKKALTALANDCVMSFFSALKKEMLKVKESARAEEEQYQRRKMLPGDTPDEVIDLAFQYLKAEMIYKNGHVTRTCFFFHFPRAFKAMFVYEKMTLERENLVAKWNKIAKENAKEKKEKERDINRDEKKKKRKKDKKNSPASHGSELMANMAGHAPSKLVQAEQKLRSAAKSHGGTQLNLLQDMENA